MQSHLLEFISVRIRIDHDLEKKITDNFTLEVVPKNHRLLTEHQYANKLYFLADGSTRSFYYHNDREITSWLYRQNNFFTSWHSFITEHRSYEYIETTEECKIYSIPRKEYYQLLSESPSFEKFGRILLEEQVAFLDHFFKGFLYMSAREKYDQFISTFPDATQRVNLGHIASFLGISQETLSRIRKKE